ncbi:MAG TPA: hypothetical protein VMU04_10550 [Candidatus Acidoferrum sp.]|nr:hypothetical protein [Candidatus Acidoferrum sp.]
MKTVSVVSFLLQLLIAPASLLAQTTAFTYQGRLLDGGQPANGSYDLQFRLADALTNGNYISNSLTNAPVIVSNGLFIAALDFGGGAFDGSLRWLEIGVRPNGSALDYTVLSPRQLINATPYAVFASAASSATIAASLVPGAEVVADGAGITNLNGAQIRPGTISSNQLDGATAAQLALAGVGGGGSIKVGSILTNVTLADASAVTFLLVTNDSWRGGPFDTLDLLLGVPAGKVVNSLWYAQDNPNFFFNMQFWPHHGLYSGDAPEMVFDISTGNLCYYYQSIQWANPTTLVPSFEHWVTGNTPYVKGGVTNWNVRESQSLWQFQAHMTTNSWANWFYTGSGGQDDNYVPSILFRGLEDGNGSGAWVFYDAFDAEPVGKYPNTHRNYDTAIERMRIVVGPDATNAALIVNGPIEATNGFILPPQPTSSTNIGAIWIWNSNNAAIYARGTNGIDKLIVGWP